MAKTSFQAKRLNAFNFDPCNLVVVGVDVPAGAYPSLYDPRVEACVPGDEAFEALVSSIKELGVLTPVTVAKVDERPFVVDGRRRVLAARALQFRTSSPVFVPAIRQSYRFSSPEKDLCGSMISANELRLDDTPIQKAEKLRRYLDEHGATEAEAAVTFGVTTQTIANWRRLSQLSPALSQAVADGEITATAAGKLARLNPEEQGLRLGELRGAAQAGKLPSVKDAEAAAANRPRPPRKRFLQRLVRHEGAAVVSVDFLAGIKYALGELEPKDQPGVVARIREMTGGSGE